MTPATEPCINRLDLSVFSNIAAWNIRRDEKITCTSDPLTNQSLLTAPGLRVQYQVVCLFGNSNQTGQKEHRTKGYKAIHTQNLLSISLNFRER